MWTEVENCEAMLLVFSGNLNITGNINWGPQQLANHFLLIHRVRDATINMMSLSCLVYYHSLVDDIRPRVSCYNALFSHGIHHVPHLLCHYLVLYEFIRSEAVQNWTTSLQAQAVRDRHALLIKPSRLTNHVNRLRIWLWWQQYSCFCGRPQLSLSFVSKAKSSSSPLATSTKPQLPHKELKSRILHLSPRAGLIYRKLSWHCFLIQQQ